MILLTGATGFLGHHMVPLLHQAGYPLRLLVRPSSDVSFIQNLDVELAYAQDITDVAAVRAACQGCRYVIHAAGHFRFWGDFEEFWQTNVKGTETILQAAVSAQVERFVHVSTIVVVGKTPLGMIDEETRCQPQEPYQITKLEAERMALNYGQAQGMPVIVVRPGAFYGPWGRYAFNRLFFEEPLRGWRIKVDGGRHITFPVFVPDVVEGIRLALTRARPGEIYNISGESLKHNEANNIISDLAGISRWRLHIPTWLVLALARSWTALSRFTGREPFYPINMASYVFQDWYVSIRKAREELGFQPTPFVEGARKTLNWYWQQDLLPKP